MTMMMDIALKEWSVVIELMLQGELTFVLRKGGIIEDHGPGMFAPKHPRFLLFPSWAHQKPMMIKDTYRDQVNVQDEPDQMEIKAYADVVGLWQVPSRQAFEQLNLSHCWTSEQIDMRFNYKPQNPLFLKLFHVHRLARPRIIENDLSYGGCLSWIQLISAHAVDTQNAKPVLPLQNLISIRDQISQCFDQASSHLECNRR